MALLLTISLLTAALTVYHLANRNSRLGKLINKIPGPKGLPVIGNLLDFLITEGRDRIHDISRDHVYHFLNFISDNYYFTYHNRCNQRRGTC